MISGYNTASAEEKAKYDIDKLCQYMGNYIFILAKLFLILAIFSMISEDKDSQIFLVMGILIAITAIGGIIFMITKDRVKKTDNKKRPS